MSSEVEIYEHDFDERTGRILVEIELYARTNDISPALFAYDGVDAELLFSDVSLDYHAISKLEQRVRCSTKVCNIYRNEVELRADMEDPR